MAYRGRPSAVGRWRSDRAHPEPLWLLRSVIVVSIFIGPGWLLEQQVRFTRRGSTKMTKTITRTAGIDTSKAKLDVALHGGECWQVANAASGWRSLARKLAGAGVARVGIEATGGYERGVVGYLRESGFEVLVLQPIQVRAYARVHLRRAKNDVLDAVLIAACTAAIEGPRHEPDARLSNLAQHLTFVEQIEEDIARFKVRLEHIEEPRLRRIVMINIVRLKTLRTAELARIVRALRIHEDLGHRRSRAQHSGYRGAHRARDRHPHARAWARQPRGSSRAGWPGAVRSRQRKTSWRTTHRRRSRQVAPLTVCCSASCRIPLEQTPDRSLRAPHSTRKSPQRSSRCMRQKADRLRQHRRSARHPLDRTTRRDLMVATAE